MFYTGNPLLSPPSQISSLPSPDYSSLINDRLLINHNCKTLCGIIQDVLFTKWKFGFDSDPRLPELKSLYLNFSTLSSSTLWRTDTIVIPLK